MCPVAARIPEVQRGGIIHDDSQEKMRRYAYARIVGVLRKAPQYIAEVCSYLGSSKQAKSSVTKDGFSSGSAH